MFNKFVVNITYLTLFNMGFINRNHVKYQKKVIQLIYN
jgi:hypothetical protein